jgi:soluble lytic murein transglycosylase
LEEALVKAVIKVESDYQPSIVSKKGAQGLMQLIPETAKLLKVDNPFDPSENIRGGSEYLRQMLDLFNDDLELALAAYNSGPTTVKRFGGIPPYDETRNYVKRVKRYLNYYRQAGDTLL